MGIRNHHGCKYRGFISAASIPLRRAPHPSFILLEKAPPSQHPSHCRGHLTLHPSYPPALTPSRSLLSAPIPRASRSPPIISPSPTHLEVAAVCPDASCCLEHLLVHDQPVIHIQTRGSRLAHNCRGLHRICWTRRLARDGGGQPGCSSYCLAQHQGCGW